MADRRHGVAVAVVAAVEVANGPNRADGDADDGTDGMVNQKRQQRLRLRLPSAVGGSSRKRTPTLNPDTNHQSWNPASNYYHQLIISPGIYFAHHYSSRRGDVPDDCRRVDDERW